MKTILSLRILQLDLEVQALLGVTSLRTPLSVSDQERLFQVLEQVGYRWDQSLLVWQFSDRQSHRVDLQLLSSTLQACQDTLLSGMVQRVLLDMTDLLVTKGADYSGQSDTWWNFEAASRATNTPVSMVFLGLIGVKIARLQNLLQSSQSPNHESLQDTWKDLANYIILYLAYQKWANL